MLRDKALLPFAGTTLLAHALTRLQSLGFHARLAGSPQSASQGPESPPSIPDNYPGSGPLAGIEAALTYVTQQLEKQASNPRSTQQQPPKPVNVLFLPVDVPLLPAAFLTYLSERAQQSGALATIPFAGGRPQPLCAVYSTALAPFLCNALAADQRKVMHVLAAATAGQPVPQPVDSFPVEALLSANPSAVTPSTHPVPPHLWFANLNTPQDWSCFQARHLLDQSGQTGLYGI
jgi:molybdopterin-guanine dinucleotide biosynthesis protein A